MPYIGRELDSGNYLKLDDISSSFNGSTTTFNLTAGGKAFFPGSAFSILVNLAGVAQEPEAAYQINNSQITFATAPASGDQFFCIVLGVAHGVNVPGNGTVDGAQLAKPFNYDGYFYLDDANNRVGVGTATPSKPLHVVGEGQFDSVRVLGDLTVDGTTTTLDTVVTEVDRLEVGANNSTVGVAITQSGTGDILNLYDGSTEVFSVADGGKVLVGTQTEGNANADNLTIADATNTGITIRSGTSNIGSIFFSDATSGGGEYAGFIDYNHSSNQMSLGTAENTRITITSAGNFGIGTNNPTSKLQVANGHINLSSGYSIQWSDSHERIEQSDGKLEFFTANGEKMTLTGSNLGIGTADPQSQFEVYGSSPIVRSKHSTSQKYVQLWHNSNDAFIDWSADDLILRSGGTTERLRITSAGNVGINDTNPNYSLVVGGQDQAVMIRQGNGALAALTHNTSQKLWFQGGNAELGLFSDASGNLEYILGTWQSVTHIPLVFRTGNRAERMRITFDGKVGIGLTNPQAQFDMLHGAIRLSRTASYTSHVEFSVTHASSSDYGSLYFDNSNATGDYVFRTTSSNTERLRITSAGDVGIGDNNPNSNYGTNLSVHSTATDGARLKISDGTTGKGNLDGLDIISTGGIAYFINRENADMSFSTGGGERLRITSAGNVGINDTNASRALSIKYNDNTAYSTAAYTPAGGVIKIFNESTTAGCTAGEILFGARNSGTGYASINAISPGSQEVELAFRVMDGGTFNEALYINKSGVKQIKNGNLNIQSTYIDFSGDQSSTPTTAVALYRPADGTFAISTQNTERLRITSGGQFLHGATSNSAGYNLVTAGSGYRSILLGSTSGATAALIIDGAANGDGQGSDYASIEHNSSGEMRYKNRQSSSSGGAGHIFYTTSSDTERLRINSDAMVLAPSMALTVKYNSSTQKDLTYTSIRYIYISDSGNDSTGDGSSSSPWRTMSKALAEVPKFLVWNCYIQMKGSSFTDGTGSNTLEGICGPGKVIITSESGTVTYNKTKQFVVYDCHSRIEFQNIAFVCPVGGTGFALERNHYIDFKSGCSYEFQGQSGWSWQAGVYALYNDRIIVSCNTTCTNSSTSGLGGVWYFDNCRAVSFGGDLTKNGTQFNNHGISCVNGTWIYLSGDITNFVRGLSLGANHYGNETRADAVIAGTTISNCGTGVQLYNGSLLRNYSSTFSNNSNTNIDLGGNGILT